MAETLRPMVEYYGALGNSTGLFNLNVPSWAAYDRAQFQSTQIGPTSKPMNEKWTDRERSHHPASP
jgi:hypothetical protein